MMSYFHDNHNSKDPSLREQTVWNSLSGLLAALEMVIMTMITTRLISLESAGEITIAFAYGNLFRTIGFWGVRNFQISDRTYVYSFAIYRQARFFSLILMFFSESIHLIVSYIFNGMSCHKFLVIASIEIFFLFECYEDVVWGEYQRRGRIDIGAKLFLIRWGSFLGLFFISVYVFRDIVPALILSLCISVLLFCLSLKFIFGLPKVDSNKNNWGSAIVQTKELLKTTLPLCIITFLSFFINNIAKYSLDYYYDSSIQAYFGFITLPMFAVEMLSAFIYQPKLAKLSSLWIKRNIEVYISEILRQMIYIFVITVCCALFVWFLGCQVLSLLFATDLSDYRFDLILCILCGGAVAFITYASALLTIMRRQIIQLIQYVAASIIGGLLIYSSVRSLGIRGGTVGNLLIFLVLGFSLYLTVALILRKEKYSILYQNHNK